MDIRKGKVASYVDSGLIREKQRKRTNEQTQQEQQNQSLGVSVKMVKGGALTGPGVDTGFAKVDVSRCVDMWMSHTTYDTYLFLGVY
ncbi:hypothetical protein E0Z10_g8906 [Xylaria hypoxylon]|uniref:Uncharacterized protein n=1 Tax=Xylaria hypoxylon TaxID=37992 RepID=A0A4Z0YLR4_9PEZI|nr:hypothetical protein E0Z10_g8906 [Xylaria hypoxylon]